MNKEALKEYKKKLSTLSSSEIKERNLYLRNLSLGTIQGPGTGYLSIDKPWLKYYSEDAITKDIPNMSAYEYMCYENQDNLDAFAISYFGKKITFKKFEKEIDKTAEKLYRLGIRPKDVVTVMSVANPEIEILFYALNKMGAVINLIDVRSDAKSIANYINEVKSTTVLVMDNFLPEFDKALNNTQSIKNVITVSPYNSVPFPFNKISNLAFKKDSEELSLMLKEISKKNKLPSIKEIIRLIKKIREVKKQKNNSKLYNEITNIKKKKKYISWNHLMNIFTPFKKVKVPPYQKDTLAALVHTGGTTGISKTVKLSNDNFNAMALQYKLLDTGYSKKDTFLNGIVPFVAYGIVATIHMPMSLGITNIIAPILSPKEFTESMIQYKPNHTLTVPSYVEDFIHDKEALKMDWSCLKHLGIGGDTLSETKERECNAFLESHNSKAVAEKGYGMTELSSTAILCLTTRNKLLSLGIPLPKVNVGIFEENTDNELLYNQVGELCITGDSMMQGYLDNEEEEKKVMIQHNDKVRWIHSGDAFTADKDGFLYFKGRLKRMMAHGGFKIYPQIMEQVIQKNSNIENCCVITIPSEEFGSSPEAHIVLKEDRINKWKEIKKELIALCQEELPNYSQPTDFILEDDLPLTTVGKVDYKKLEKKREEELKRK